VRGHRVQRRGIHPLTQPIHPDWHIDGHDDRALANSFTARALPDFDRRGGLGLHGRSVYGAPPMEAVELEFRHVSRRYADVVAVNDLSFEVPAGKICVLVGPSGCGKTTSLKMVNRLIEPTGGQILVGGRDVMAQDPIELRRGIGYVIQQVGLMPHLTVGDNIAVVPRLMGWDKPRISARVDELLGLVGLEPTSYRNRFPAQLSGGERQRIGVARALAVDPPLMLMDEPFGAVDPIVRERLQNELLRLQEQLAKTIVFVTHDIDEAIKMGDLVAVMQVGGVLAQFGPPGEILGSPASEFVARFVGADRGLKRLSLTRVGDLELVPRPPDFVPQPGQPVVGLRTTLKDALSQMLDADVSSGVVADENGSVVGLVTYEQIAAALHDHSDGHARD
jgi:osmoprotectant transport system ATP-binding protein